MRGTLAQKKKKKKRYNGTGGPQNNLKVRGTAFKTQDTGNMAFCLAWKTYFR